MNRLGFAAGLGTAFLGHVGAHADFGAVAREIMELVRLIDGLNAVRFKDQPKLLAEWQAARNVSGSVRDGWRAPGSHPEGANLSDDYRNDLRLGMK